MTIKSKTIKSQEAKAAIGSTLVIPAQAGIQQSP